MEQHFAEVTVTVNAPASKVWQALTDPEMVKQYLFDTNLKADWKVGGKITYSGEWEGKPYEDRGTILELEPGKRLVTTYFSDFYGKEDKPENYSKIWYEITDNGTQCTLLVKQTSQDERSAEFTREHWQTALDKLKKLAEQ